MPGTDDQPNASPNWIKLWKKDPGQTARQFCLIQVQLDLFGDAALVIEQSCIGGGSRRKCQRYSSENEARTAMVELVNKMKRRGYVA